MDIEVIDNIQPAFDHNWDISFVVVSPPPFLLLVLPDLISSGVFQLGVGFNMIPATAVTFSTFSLNTKSISIGTFNSEIPLDGNATEVNISFFDSENRALEKFFKAWARYTSSIEGTRLLEESALVIIINELGVEKDITNSYQYLVTPKGSYPISLGSQGQVLLFSQNLSIVGELL